MNSNNEEILNCIIVIQELLFRLNKYIEFLNIQCNIITKPDIEYYLEAHPGRIFRKIDFILENLEQKIKSFQELKNEIKSKELILI